MQYSGRHGGYVRDECAVQRHRRRVGPGRVFLDDISYHGKRTGLVRSKASGTGIESYLAGATPIPNPEGLAPGCVAENVYVLPGIPEEMRAVFDNVADDFGGTVETTR